MLKVMKRNLKQLIIFETFYNVFLTLLIPLLAKVFDLIFKLISTDFLSQENITKLFNPIIIIIIFLLAFVISITTVYEYNALNIIYTASIQHESIDFISILKNTNHYSKSVFKSKNIMLFIYICLFLPFTGILYNNPIINRLAVPTYILDYIFSHTLLSILFLTGILYLIYYTITNIYVFIYMLSDNLSYFEARKKSKVLLWKSYLELLPRFIKGFILFAFNYVLLLTLQNGIYSLIKGIDNNLIFIIISVTLIFIFTIFNAFLNIGLKTYFMYNIYDIYDNHEDNIKLEISPPKRNYTKAIILIFFIFTIFSLITSSCSYTDSSQNIYTNVIAHRGNSADYLENSLAAFNAAFDNNIKYIELDVVETKDKQIVICHDKNLKRLANINTSIKDLTYEEIKNLTLFSNGHTGKIMLLDDLLKIVPDDVCLDIEIKVDNNAKEIATLVESLISNYKRHLISSLNENVLKYVKEINPSRKCGYIMVIALGNYQQMDFADFFCIERSFVNAKTVLDIHSQNKKVFVWMVNNMTEIEELVHMNVDGIITDTPLEAKRSILEAYNNYKKYDLQQLIGSYSFK